MTELTREERRTSKMREILPIYGFIELTVDSIDGAARCSVPLSRANANHVGIMHAGVIFLLAEATGGVAVSLHKEFSRHAIIAKNVAVRYRRPVSTRLHAMSVIDSDGAAALRKGLANDPNHAFDVTVVLHDEQEKLVAECVCTFVLRAMG